MKIKYFSDLHLEFLPQLKSGWVEKLLKNNSTDLTNSIDVLVLAGDIGDPFSTMYKEFLIQINQLFPRTYLITGNHEYYNKNKKSQSIESIDLIIKDIIESLSLSNIKFLSNSYDDWGGFRFVGSTLWSKIINQRYLINDFEIIKNMTVQKYNSLHLESKNFIEQTILSSELPIIMITHHLPSYSLIDPKYASCGEYNQCFASDLDHLITSPIKAWFYGHTHTPNYKIVNQIHMCCNPIGYPGESQDPDFNKILEL